MTGGNQQWEGLCRRTVRSAASCQPELGLLPCPKSMGACAGEHHFKHLTRLPGGSRPLKAAAAAQQVAANCEVGGACLQAALGPGL